MLLTSFTYCERVEANPEAYVIINPLPVVLLPAVPSLYSFNVSIGLADLASAIGSKLELKILNSQKQQVFSMSTLVPNNPENKDGMVLNAIINNLLIKEEGIYTTVIINKEETLGEVPFKVITVKETELVG